MNKEHKERLAFYKDSWMNLSPDQLDVAAFYFDMCESLTRQLRRKFPSAHMLFVDGLKNPGTYNHTSTGHHIISIDPNHTVEEMRGIVCHELAHQYMEITGIKQGRKYHNKKFDETWWIILGLALKKGYDIRMPKSGVRPATTSSSVPQEGHLPPH